MGKLIEVNGESYELREGFPEDHMLLLQHDHLKTYFGRKDSPDLIAFFVVYMYVKQTVIDKDVYSEITGEEHLNMICDILKWTPSKTQKIWAFVQSWAAHGEPNE